MCSTALVKAVLLPSCIQLAGCAASTKDGSDNVAIYPPYVQPLSQLRCPSCIAPEIFAMHPTTPDGHYFVVKGQLWRCTNPSLTEQERQRLVHDLMNARRDVKKAKRAEDSSMLKSARARVNAAKVRLGERGPFGGTTAARTTIAVG